MAVTITSEALCRRAYLDYHCYGNTLGTTPQEMGKIVSYWQDRVFSWQNSISDDVNEYDFSDDDYDEYYDKGYKSGQDATGYEKCLADDAVAVSGHGAAGVIGTASGAVGAAATKAAVTEATKAAVTEGAKIATKEVVSKLGSGVIGKALGQAVLQEAAKEAVKEGGKEVTKKLLRDASAGAVKSIAKKSSEEVVDMAAQKIGEKATEESAEKLLGEASKNVGKSLGCIIGCTMALATGTAYMAKKPNKEEYEATGQLVGEMGNAQAALGETQEEMSYMADELMALSDEAYMFNEEANIEIEEQKSEYDLYMETYLTLKAKIDSGQGLTKEEKSTYKALVGYLQETGQLIVETQEETTAIVGEVYDDMATYQEGYDYAAQTVAEVDGLTGYAESFDKATQIMCYVEGGAQALNVASGGWSAAQAFALAASGSWAFGATAWAYAFGVMGIAGVGMSTYGMAEQFKWAGEIGNEIEMRKTAQDINAETNDIYDVEIDNYDGLMGGVEDLDIEMPDDVAPPEDTAIPIAEAEEKNSVSTNGTFGLVADSKKKQQEAPAKKESA